MRSRPTGTAGALLAATLIVAAACSSNSKSSSTPRATAPATTAERVPGGPTGSYLLAAGIHKIRHVIVIQQENRSFDTYFGTFPGADGIPMQHGKPTVCVPDPRTSRCIAPYVDHADVNGGGPHNFKNASADVHDGLMDGFIAEAESGRKGCTNPTDPACTNSSQPDVMGYHTESDIPNYWSYAKDFVLQDHMFEPVASWSLPSHLFLVSEWSANCTQHDNPSSCVNSINALRRNAGRPPDVPAYLNGATTNKPIYAWTDLTHLLYQHHVSWGYYVVSGSEPDCEDDGAETCAPVAQHSWTPGIWNPLPWFDTVKSDRQLNNVQDVKQFYAQAAKGTLPAVSWVVPSSEVSEHPPSPVSFGQSYVTSLVNAVMRGPDWDSTAIFLAWDD